jgi:hypothetical protein
MASQVAGLVTKMEKETPATLPRKFSVAQLVRRAFEGAAHIEGNLNADDWDGRELAVARRERRWIVADKADRGLADR